MRSVIILLFLCFFSMSTSWATNSYVGASKCKSCHKKKKSGEQYPIWTKGSHFKAFKTLGTKKAIDMAKEMGLSNPPQKEKACLICHTKSQFDENGKARPAKQFGKKYKAKEGVQCEDCHGPGKKYVKKKTMKAITREGGVAKSATAKKTGLWVPNENTCKQCHTAEVTIGGVAYKNPSFKSFDFAKRAEEIKHPIPKK